MKYQQAKFSVGYGSKDYRDGWERTFGKKPETDSDSISVTESETESEHSKSESEHSVQHTSCDGENCKLNGLD